MLSRACVLPAICLALFVTIGCGGEPPEKEMQQAEGALAAAQAAGADRYAEAEYSAAQAALANAREAVTQRDYRLALDRALDSRERAQNAARQAADGKALARGNAERALAAAEAQIATLDEKVTAAEATKATARLVGGPRKAVNTARTALQEARATFDKGDYIGATSRATAVTAALPEASASLDAALAPPARRRR